MQSNRWRRHRVVQRAVKKHIDDIHNTGHDDSVIADDTDHSVINTLESNPSENNVTHDFDSVNADDDDCSLPDSHECSLPYEAFDYQCDSENLWVLSSDEECVAGANGNASEQQFSSSGTENPAVSDDEAIVADKYDPVVQELSQWAIQHSVTHSAINDLLKILNKYHSVPKDARTLLHTIRSSNVQHMKDSNGNNGDYVYFGLETELIKHLQHDLPVWLQNSETIQLLFNIDGLPLYRSSSKQFWPILCRLYNDVVTASKVLIIAVFCGSGKPASPDVFLKDFIQEILFLQDAGLKFDGKTYSVVVKGFVCDAPARAFVKCIKGHCGYFGCDKCCQKGKYLESKLTFPEIDAVKRSDNLFVNQTQPEHHKGVSPIVGVKIGLVSGFPLDYMHLVCLGVMKKLLLTWLHGSLTVRIGSHQVEFISSEVLRYAQFVCAEFA